MARAWVRRHDLEVGDMPDVCARTGQHTADRVRMTFHHVPDWTWLLLLFGIVPFFVARYFAAERIDGLVPLARSELDRLRRVQRLQYVLFCAFAGLLLLGLVTARPGLAQFALVPLVGGLAAAAVGALTSIGGHVDGSGLWFRLTGVHHHFAALVDARYALAEVDPILTE